MVTRSNSAQNPAQSSHGNENATALQAGNSPAMLYGTYKGLATKKEAEAWFAVAPAQAQNVTVLSAASCNQGQ